MRTTVPVCERREPNRVRTLASRCKTVPMSRRSTLTWNHKDVPPELRDLPTGRYSAEAVDEEAPAPTPEEEAGIEAALEGRVVESKRAREIIDAALGR